METSPRHRDADRVPKTSAFEDLDRLTDAHGLVAIISRHIHLGYMTFAIFRESERRGRQQGTSVRTAFIPEALIPAFIAMTDLARQRMEQLRAGGAAGAGRVS